MLKKFAEELKEARSKSGISIQQIHNKTRIDVKFLEAIENGNFEILPEVYLRAVIREFANSVGLDEAQTMKRYDAAKSGKMIEEKENTDETADQNIKEEKHKKTFTGAEHHYSSDEEETSSKQFRINPKVVIILGVVAIIGLVIYYIFFYNSSSEIITERPFEEIVSENRQRYEPSESDSLKQLSSGNMLNDDSLVLMIKAKDTSWIGVKRDNSKAETDFILMRSNRKIIKAARNFVVTVGNSRNVEFYLNNKPLNFYGSYKERKIVQIDSAGLSYLPVYRSEEKKND